MPFRFADDMSARGNDSDELPHNLTADDVSELIGAALSEQIAKWVNEALRSELYRLTGNLDYLPEKAPKRPRGKR